MKRLFARVMPQFPDRRQPGLRRRAPDRTPARPHPARLHARHRFGGDHRRVEPGRRSIRDGHADRALHRQALPGQIAVAKRRTGSDHPAKFETRRKFDENHFRQNVRAKRTAQAGRLAARCGGPMTIDGQFAKLGAADAEDAGYEKVWMRGESGAKLGIY